MEKCYACGKRLGKYPHVADTLEDQIVYVGSECYKLILQSDIIGYQPPKGGPRLYPLTNERKQILITKGLYNEK